MKESQSRKFCSCIKQVAKYVRPITGRGPAAKEGAAIAICVKKVLQSRGRTLKRFSCKKGAKVQTQKMKRS